MAKITYTNKVALNENPEIALINKVTDDDLNEIKSVVNTNDDNVGNLTNLTTTTKTNIVAAVNEINSNAASATDLGDISDLTTTDKTSAVNAINELNSDKAPDDIILVQSSEPTSDSNILWINDGQIGTPASEITNSYSESTGIGYSANYINEHYGWSEVTEGYTLLDNYIYYKKVGKMVTLFRPARTIGGYVQNDISLAEFNYTNIATGLPKELRPNARIAFPIFAHTTGNQILTTSYGEVMENGNIAVYNWSVATTLNRLAFCVTYMVD